MYSYSDFSRDSPFAVFVPPVFLPRELTVPFCRPTEILNEQD